LTPAAPSARLDRFLRYAAPVLFLILAGDVLDGILSGPQRMWNEARLARGIAVAYGYPLYPGQHALGAVIGTMHAPFGYLIYAGLAVLKDPVLAIVTGCALSAVLYFGPLFWIHMRVGETGRLCSLYGFLACSAIVLASPGSKFSALNVHVDAAAACTAVLAAGILATSRTRLGNALLAASAALGVLSVFSKQTMAPVPVALACFVLLAEGPRRFLRYVLFQFVSCITIGASFLLALGPRNLIFNTVTMATHLGPRPSADLARGVSIERIALSVAVPVLAILFAGLAFDSAGGVRARVAANRWLVFLFAGVLQVPFALRGWSTTGGDTNHLGMVTLFIALAATTGLIMTPPMPALIQRSLLIGIIVATLVLPWSSLSDAAVLNQVPSEVAFRYERQHPGRAYFPMNPLAVLLAGGKLTQFDPALDDRGRTGFALTPEQFTSGLPPHYLLIACPPTYDAPRSALVQQLLRFMKPVKEPGLEDWNVFGPAGAGTH